MASRPLDYLAANVADWARQADRQRAAGRRNWAVEPRWGIFGLPDAGLGVIPADAQGLRVLELLELRPPESASSSSAFVTAEWARHWPCEEVWRARLRD